MKPSICIKFVAAAALALGAVSTAHARSDVYVSVGVQGAPVYVEPAPVYRPVYAQPPVYYPAPAYRPAPVYQPAPSRHWRGRDYRDDRDSFDDRVFSRHDVDGDGVPNWKDSRDDRSQPIWWREGYHPSRDEAYATPYRRRH